jgi:hypothetical protein
MDKACGSVLVSPSLDNLPTPISDSSAEAALSTALQLSQSLHSFHPRASSLPLNNALDSCTILYYAAKSSPDPVVRESLLSQALSLGTSICAQIINPLSPFLPDSETIKSARSLVLLTRSEIIQLLCLDYTKNRDLIHEHIGHLLRMSGYIISHDSEILISFKSIKEAILAQPWPISRRVQEWITIARNVPSEPHFVGLRFWSYYSTLKIELGNVEMALQKNDLTAVNYVMEMLMEVLDQFQESMQLLNTEEGRLILSRKNGQEPEHYFECGEEILGRFQSVKMEVDTKLALARGDALLELATEKVRESDVEYFKFQALLALESYRTAWGICSAHEEVVAELEGLCLWNMGRVMGLYLGLHESAHRLYLQGVLLVTRISPLLPNAGWFADAVTRIEEYRRQMVEDEERKKRRERDGVVDRLTFDLLQLYQRAERVKDEQTLRNFFHWLLHTHPPRYSIGSVKDALESRKLCKVVLNIIALYDSSERHAFDEPWQVLCEEIIKVQALLSN